MHAQISAMIMLFVAVQERSLQRVQGTRIYTNSSP
jgi:hypothetical protein